MPSSDPIDQTSGPDGSSADEPRIGRTWRDRWQARAWIAIAVLGASVASILVWTFITISRVGSQQSADPSLLSKQFLYMGLVLAAFAIAAACLAVRARRVRTLVREANGQICPWCLYDLTDVPETPEQLARCPECGHLCDLATLAKHWDWAIHDRRRKPAD